MPYTGGLNYASATGTLTINGVSMHTPAWAMVNLLPLWNRGDVRGSDVTIPRLRGTHAYKRRTHEAKHSLPMAIVGTHDWSGTPYTDTDLGRRIGVQTNLAYLEANIVTTDAVATYGATLTMPDASVLTANVVVERIATGQNFDDLTWATLELVIPSGFFE